MGSSSPSRVPPAARGWLSGSGSQVRDESLWHMSRRRSLTKPIPQGPHLLPEGHSFQGPGREGAATALHAGAQSDAFSPGAAVPPWSSRSTCSPPITVSRHQTGAVLPGNTASIHFCPGRRNQKVNPRPLFFIKKEKMFANLSLTHPGPS